MAPRYLTADDRTLTASQAKEGAFKKAATEKIVRGNKTTSAEFRVASNPTKAESRHSTGHHEGAAPTDMAVLLSGRTKGTVESTLPATNSKTALRHYSRGKIREANVRPVMEASDGARPDTARTFLSVPGGGAAGHSGSDTHTAGQAAGHDFNRVQMMKMLRAPDLTPPTAGVASAALVVMSMAPGERAATVKDARKLKDRGARRTYESDRNAAKTKLARYYHALPAAGQATVMSLARSAMSDLQDSRRRLLPDAPHSPLRHADGPAGAAIAGGGYMQPPPLALPPPTAASGTSGVAAHSAHQAAAASASSAVTPHLPAVAAAGTGGSKRKRADAPPAGMAASATPPTRVAAIHARPATPAVADPSASRANKRPRADQAPQVAAAAASPSAGSHSPAAATPFPSPRNVNLDISGHFRAPRR
ncbi:hypothetical protein [Dyella sp. 2RAB6]|uniref:hypothetical protein n=1 Tax=Dyella sp. 2RAB6 TaxID=3232992 RepID=UPI003F90D27E